MNQPSTRLPDRELSSGDRVRIQQGTKAIPKFIGRIGMIVETFRLPEGSCMVRIDGDNDNQRAWFFYADELALSEG